MEEKFNRFCSRLEALLADSVDDDLTKENMLENEASHALKNLLLCIVTSLLIALAINIAIIFISPEQWTLRSCFRMKDPVSVILGFLMGTTIVRKISKDT